jgi:hypothetical protein
MFKCSVLMFKCSVLMFELFYNSLKNNALEVVGPGGTFSTLGTLR